MAATAGHLATISVTGASTTMTAEATSNTAGFSYQITNTAKRIVDPAVAIVIKHNSGVTWPTNFTFDYLNGIVTLDGAPTGAVTIDGAYLPARQIAQAYELDVSLAANLAESSLLGTTFIGRTRALSDITGSMSCYDAGLTEYTDVQLYDLISSGTTKVVDIQWNGGTNYLRFFAMFESVDPSASVDGVQSLSASFSANAQTALTTGQEVDYTIV